MDSHVDKIIVHKDHFDWKLTSSSDIINRDDEEKENGKFITRIVITYDDIVEFNEKKHFLKKIKQKDPIIMDIYI